MQPFEYVVLFFWSCLLYGIYRAIQDVRREVARDAMMKQLKETISKMTGLSESFRGLAKSAECANESIKRLSVLFPHYGWPIIDNKTPGYLSRDSIS